MSDSGSPPSARRPGIRTAVPRAATPIVPPTPPAPRWRMNPTAIVLAVVIGAVMVPFILRFERQRFSRTSDGPGAPRTADQPKVRDGDEESDSGVPHEKRQWRMHGLDGITEKQAIERFGPPLSARTFSLTAGSFAGPLLGLKHYYLMTAANHDKTVKEAEVSWTYPEYTAIREVIWQLPDSFLTLWMHEPRAEISLEGDSANVTFPGTASGEWVAIDNFRVGKDLIKAPPAGAR